MTSRTAQLARVFASLDASPLPDRYHQLGEAIEQHGRDIDKARDEHRADCLARYGYDIFAGENGNV